MLQENPKSEIRNPKQIRSMKSEIPNKVLPWFRISDFGFQICFGNQISCFEFSCQVCLLLLTWACTIAAVSAQGPAPIAIAEEFKVGYQYHVNCRVNIKGE